MNEKVQVFEDIVKKVSKWHEIESSSLSNIFKKFFSNPFKYTVYQFSKISPIDICAETFLGDRFHCYLPDYFLMWRYGIVGDPSEIKLTRFILNNLKQGDIMLDVGSNCGFYTLLGSKIVGDLGSVHAFEPTPHMYQKLKTNTENLNNVRTLQVAVSDRVGESDFSINKVFAVANSLVISNPESDRDSINVKTITLDNYCNEKNIIPNFIKLDVEGAEELVIQGLKNILDEASPTLSLEILKQGNDTDLGATRLLVEKGYFPHKILDDGRIEVVSVDSMDSYISNKQGAFDNFIFKKIS